MSLDFSLTPSGWIQGRTPDSSKESYFGYLSVFCIHFPRPCFFQKPFFQGFPGNGPVNAYGTRDYGGRERNTAPI